MILILEGIFIGINSKILSNLYQERAKQILKEDTILVKLVAEGNPRTKYQELFSNNALRFTLVDLTGKVVFDSKKTEEEEKRMDNHLQREEIQEAIEKKESFTIRYSETFDTVMAYYAVSIKNSVGEEYILRTASEYSKELLQIREFLLVQIVFFLILNYVIHFFYKNYIKRDFYTKIKRMRKFLESGEMEKINYSKDEYWLFEFWDILKEWQGKNLKNISKLEKERRILSEVLHSVDLFIGLLDSEGKFIVKNTSLKYVVDPYEEKYLEAIKYLELITPIKNGLVNKKEYREDIYIQSLKKYFLFTMKYLEFSNRFIITIKDITSTREAVEVQKTFINNVSHELKTPLTNIKGYLIALEDAPEVMRKKFLNTIKTNVERLENIVLDFLNISKIENSNLVNISQVAVEKIKKELLEILSGKINEKGAKVDFLFNLTDGRDYLKVDSEKIFMILKNLIENGIIYNKNSEPEVIVKVDEKGDRYNISVEDNGIGIPIYEQDKIFERFYRIDKVRTSNLGGTGLGLSIVKTLIEKCGGGLVIDSIEGKGTIFSFYILK
ncbi:two-component sensor histidine kinase [Fusobacterium mortiferum]|jgi:two-component system phosphate regulon sensor histidine kinase PhoR|uniref:sensor histidine kinase n=1 Tax=Fusobacterium mortiferum TaxID=850 RepID=UPI00164E1463|nr:ATP-binding protein [Fusobacterium mortiferum]MCF2626958.1 two-component sensor histidine kinase [Fusobacterium mortiferum]MCF2698822.1 two-component sensor histidine kinase [Fusobacterium mortiferum]MCI7664605.1 ATP-binding protein [Fusobacterium mortiferum]MDD7262291.1 ATP-binding protein [Fusobacterium mortiferum]MDY2799803.1 ATP-binding protein [Fusobacterium mortiferum]